MKIRRAVERGRDQDVVATAKIQNFFVNEGQVSCDNKLQVSTLFKIQTFCAFNYVANQREIQEGLTTLKLDFYPTRWRSKDECESLVGRFARHVEC
jgi:hypothetical protein